MNAELAEEVAGVLDDTRDVLMVEGRSGNYQDASGVCVIHAIGRAVYERMKGPSFDVDHYDELMHASQHALRACIGRDIVSWNFNATDDEVHDALAVAAKKAREVAA